MFSKFRQQKSWVGTAVVVGLLLVLATAVAASTYLVKPGDTLFRIALNFGVTVDELVKANNIANPNLIYVGQELQIPDGTPTTPTATPPPSSTPTPNPSPAPGGTYIVKPGDTLFRIALRFGTTVAAIAQANHLTNTNIIYVGQVLIIPGGTGGPVPTLPPGNSNFALGGQSTGFSHKDTFTQAGMTWIKIQAKWTAGNSPNDLAAIINEAHGNGFKILISVPGAQTYPQANSIDFVSYVNYVKGVAGLGPDAIEIWNEMNIDFEWPAGQISPATYVTSMLAPAYNGIKAVNPNVWVIAGALAPTGFDNGTNAWADDRYLAGLKTAGAASYMDCMGVHHNAGATSPAVSTGHPAGTHYSWYFQPTMNLYYTSLGRPLCFTELGYLSADGFPGLPAAFSWASNTSVAEHAQWLADAARIARDSGKVKLVIVYNVDLTLYDVNGDPQAGYAIIRPDGSCPACGLLKNVANGQ